MTARTFLAQNILPHNDKFQFMKVLACRPAMPMGYLEDQVITHLREHPICKGKVRNRKGGGGGVGQAEQTWYLYCVWNVEEEIVEGSSETARKRQRTTWE